VRDMRWWVTRPSRSVEVVLACFWARSIGPRHAGHDGQTNLEKERISAETDILT